MDTTQPETRKKSPGRPLLGYGSHPEAAYRIRETGLLWSEVGHKMGLRSPNAHRIAQRNARKFAFREGLAWPPMQPKKDLPLPEGGQESYTLRTDDVPWPEIGEQTGLGTKARGRAQRYAELTGQPWPVNTDTRPLMEQAYQLKIDDPSRPWSSIATEVGYSHSNHACTGAARFWTQQALETLTQGQSHTTRPSSRCGEIQAGDKITLKPVSELARLSPNAIVLVTVKNILSLRKIKSVSRRGALLQGRSPLTAPLSQIHGLVEN